MLTYASNLLAILETQELSPNTLQLPNVWLLLPALKFEERSFNVQGLVQWCFLRHGGR